MIALQPAPPDRVPLDLRQQLLRQINHWEGAAERLDDFESTATPAAWATLERYVGVTMREELKSARAQLRREASLVRTAFNAVRSRADVARVADLLAVFRNRYLQTELLVDFYVDAVRARGSEEVGAQLRACDTMATRAISTALDQLGHKTPPLLTYFKPGRGASILRIGTKLWDGSLSRVAAIKLTYHNRFRTTALFHECGHQVAGITGWNQDFAQALRGKLPGTGGLAGEAAGEFGAWASEMAADAFAFAHSGYAAVVALSDVVAGRGAEVFRYLPGDPHPISYLRVQLGVEMCRRFYGMGPWDELAAAWKEFYPTGAAPDFAGELVAALTPLLPRVVDLALLTPLPCFHGRRLADIINPSRVAPSALRLMERNAGGSAYVSSHWIWTECLRLTALSGLRYATDPERGAAILKQQEDMMIRLGNMSQETP